MCLNLTGEEKEQFHIIYQIKSLLSRKKNKKNYLNKFKFHNFKYNNLVTISKTRVFWEEAKLIIVCNIAINLLHIRKYKFRDTNKL